MGIQQPTAYSVYRIGSKERSRLEDYAENRWVRTAVGLELLLGIVCDGVGSAEWGVLASKIAVDLILTDIKNSHETDIPTLLIGSIKQANQQVYERIRGEGNTTAALVVVHLNDVSAPNGRLFIASIGDSPIYLVRNSQLSRLNIDHNVATAVRHDELTAAEAGDSPAALTRALGVRSNIDVDIGIYEGESETNIIPTYVAEKIGRRGLVLEPGDTIFACSDGLREISPSDGKPYLEDRLIIAHALDSDVQKTANTLISYVEMREPTDNLSISLIFIPSPKRKKNYVSTRLPVNVLVGILAVAIVVVAAALFLVNNTNEQLSMVARTGTAVADAQQTQTQAQANVIVSYTRTPSPTWTPSLTPTQRPAFIGDFNVIGAVYNRTSADPFALLDRDEYTANEDSLITIQENPNVSEPGLVFLSSGMQVRFTEVDSENSAIELDLLDGNTGAELFVWQGQYAHWQVNFADDSILETDTSCWSINYVAPQEVAITCYGNPTFTCQFNQTGVPSGQQIVWDMGTGGTQQPDIREINYDSALRHYERLQLLGGNSNMLACIAPFVDQDYDLVPDHADLCPDGFGDPASVRDDGCLIPTSTATRTASRAATSVNQAGLLTATPEDNEPVQNDSETGNTISIWLWIPLIGALIGGLFVVLRGRRKPLMPKRPQPQANAVTKPVTVFISYRRSGGTGYAQLIHDRLTARGVSTFIDTRNIYEGRFKEVIEKNIAERDYFIVILAPGTLESEWVIREIEYALECHRKIVPVLVDGFKMDKSTLPASIASLSERNAILVPPEYVDPALERLYEFLGSVPPRRG